MKFALTRTECGPDGQFGRLSKDGTAFSILTAERAYCDDDHEWSPKIPAGIYTCALGTHALSNGVPFQTYEITGVTGHSGLLFHTGNLPEVDSHGCVLLGLSRGKLYGRPDITDSRLAFTAFMSQAGGVPFFTLEVVDA